MKATSNLWPKDRNAIRLDEFARQLSCSVRHVQNLVDRGLLVPIQKSRPAKPGFLISRARFDEFIRARLIPLDGDAARVGAKAQLKGPSR